MGGVSAAAPACLLRPVVLVKQLVCYVHFDVVYVMQNKVIFDLDLNGTFCCGLRFLYSGFMYII